MKREQKDSEEKINKIQAYEIFAFGVEGAEELDEEFQEDNVVDF